MKISITKEYFIFFTNIISYFLIIFELIVKKMLLKLKIFF